MKTNTSMMFLLGQSIGSAVGSLTQQTEAASITWNKATPEIKAEQRYDFMMGFGMKYAAKRGAELTQEQMAVILSAPSATPKGRAVYDAAKRQFAYYISRSGNDAEQGKAKSKKAKLAIAMAAVAKLGFDRKVVVTAYDLAVSRLAE